MLTWDLHPLFNADQKEIPWLPVFGGLDLGKHVHPSHLCLLAHEKSGRQGKLIQLASVWFDRKDYRYQLEMVDNLAGHINLQRVHFDATRGEMEYARECGALAAYMHPVQFTRESKLELATRLMQALTREEIVLLNDERQLQSIRQVKVNLQADTTETGHGDAAWSVAMAIQAAAVGSKSVLNWYTTPQGVEYRAWNEAWVQGY